MTENLWTVVKKKQKNKSKYKVQAPTRWNKVKKRSSDRVNHLEILLEPQNKESIGSFLDLGCGNGEVTKEIATKFKIEQIWGSDVYDSKQAPEGVNYLQVENNQLGLPDDSVELLTCFMTMHHFEDFDLMMQTITRVLKPGSYLFIREHDVPPGNLKLKKTLDDLHKKFPDHAGPINYWSRDDLRKELAKHGFRHLGDSNYPKECRNWQAIYHSLFQWFPLASSTT